MQSMSGQVAMFRPRPGLGHDRTLHVLDRRLNGFALVALGPVPVPATQGSRGSGGRS